MIHITSFLTDKLSTLTEVIVDDLQANSDYYTLDKSKDYYARLNVGSVVGDADIINVHIYEGQKQVLYIAYLFDYTRYNNKAHYKVERNEITEQDILCFCNNILKIPIGEFIVDNI